MSSSILWLVAITTNDIFQYDWYLDIDGDYLDTEEKHLLRTAWHLFLIYIVEILSSEHFRSFESVN